MYRVDRNNFYQENKNASIQTPDWVSNFLFELLNTHIKNDEGIIFDPCVGKGSLLRPWKEKGYRVQGIDIKNQGFEETVCKNYLTIKKRKIDKSSKYTPKLNVFVCQGELTIKKEEKLRVSLVIMNPPFNIDETTEAYIKENYSSRPLLSKVSMLNEFYPLNTIFVKKTDGSSESNKELNYFSPVSMFFREKEWTKQEMFKILKEVAETALNYYLVYNGQ